MLTTGIKSSPTYDQLNLRSQGQGLRALAIVPILVYCIVHLPLRSLQILVYGCNSAIYISKYLFWFLFRSQTSFFLDNGKYLCRAGIQLSMPKVGSRTAQNLTWLYVKISILRSTYNKAILRESSQICLPTKARTLEHSLYRMPWFQKTKFP